MSDRSATLREIYRYPVKGLAPEGLARTRLTVGETVGCDRLYAVENGPSGFDSARPAYLPKQHFLMLMRNERLARLRTRFDDATHEFAIALGGNVIAQGNLRTAEGRAAIEQFLAIYCEDELRGPPKVLQAAGHSFSDVAMKVVSIINLATVAAIEEAVGATVDRRRFRANLYVDHWPAWHEFTLMDRTIAIGPSARVKIVKRIVRCAATNVDPQTGARDLAIPQTLLRAFGHADCGVYAEVVADGEIAVGDGIELTGRRLSP